MRPFRLLSLFLLGLGIGFSGCAAAGDKILPIHDEVLRFHAPYDFVYLRVIETLERVEGWELESTEKEKGIIVARNINFSSLADADKRNATFWLKSLGPREISVQLAPQSQRVLGGELLLQRISEAFSETP